MASVSQFSQKTCFRGLSLALAILACAHIPLYAKDKTSEYVNPQVVAPVMALIDKGDYAYNTKDLQAAVNEYKKAQAEMKKLTLPQDFKDFVNGRCAQALAQLALKKAKDGEGDSARDFIKEAVDLSPRSPGVAKAKAYLEDPKRTNPATTDEHAENVIEVNKLLRLAYGSYDLGEYEKANEYFENVLRLDPYNSAARRGMEKVLGEIGQYNKAAYDQARAKALTDVSKQWEIPVPADTTIDYTSPGNQTAGNFQQTISDKLNSIIIPRVNLDNVTALEAIDYVRRQAFRNDKSEDSANKGVNIIAEFANSNSPKAQEILNRRFNITLNNAPLSEILRYIADMSGTEVRTGEFGVRLVVGGSSDANELMTRVFKISPNFFAGESTGSEGAETDPFAPTAGNTIKVKRTDPKTILENAGVKFGPGATVQYSGTSSSLIVRNTPTNLNIVEDYLAAKAMSSNAQILIKATFIEVSKKKLEELGFDWAIGASTFTGFPPGRYIGGGTQGNGGDVSGNMPVLGGEMAPPEGVMTAGLRSGNEVLRQDPLTEMLGNDDGRFNPGFTDKRAPGILSVRAITSNFDVAVVMRGLSQNKGVDVMENPQIMARPGETATFTSSKEFIYPTDYTEPQLPNSMGGGINGEGGGGTLSQSFPVTPSHPTSFQTRNVGVSLEVEPQLSEDKTMVDLSISPKLTQFEGFINYGSPIMSASTNPNSENGLGSVVVSQNKILQPVFSSRGVPTKVTVAAGSTVVLGSLLKSKKVQFEDKVPVFGDIPYLGKMFRSSGEMVEEMAILIFVTVEVLDPAGRNPAELVVDKKQ